MEIARPVLVKDARDGVDVKFIVCHCDDGMPGSKTCIVGCVFLRLIRLFADQPTPDAAMMLGLACPIVLVGRFVLGIALDDNGRDLGVFEIRIAALAAEDESKAATTISVMIFLVLAPGELRGPVNGPEAARFGLANILKCLCVEGIL
jgi:hypothetical protein